MVSPKTTPLPPNLASVNPEILKVFQDVLPANEYSALVTWLGDFYPYQLEWILDPSEQAISCKSRQIGISYASAAFAVLWGVFFGELTTIISIGQAEASEVLNYAKLHVQKLRDAGSKMAETLVDKATEIKFPSTGRVIALPSTGGRGYSGNVILDEYAYHLTDVWDAAAAVTMRRGCKLRVISTPNGIGNAFCNLWRQSETDEDWSRHHIPIQVAIDQGFDVDLKKCRTLSKGDQRIYDQLFNCSFLNNEFQYIPTGLIDVCSFAELSDEPGDHYGGLDIGKTIDRTVLTVLRRMAGGLCVPKHVAIQKRTDSDSLERMVSEAFTQFGIKRLCVDATGMGAFPADRLRKKHGFWRVEPVTFTLNSKEELATKLWSAFNERKVQIPSSDKAMPLAPPGYAKDLRDDLCSIQRQVTRAGNVRYDAEHTETGHADRAWSFALALHAAGSARPRGHIANDIAAVL